MRARGVMEKCTYCLQRIRASRTVWGSRRRGDRLPGRLPHPGDRLRRPFGSAARRWRSSRPIRAATPCSAIWARARGRPISPASATSPTTGARPHERLDVRQPARPRPDLADRDRPRAGAEEGPGLVARLPDQPGWTVVFVGAVFYSFMTGVGAWGNNTSVVWGFPIASYVWWIALASGGTLISSLLTVTRQSWRASINRFAEAMTIFSIGTCGLLPNSSPRACDVLHLARPLSQPAPALAAVAQRAGLGLLGDLVLPDLLDPVLLPRPDPRPRHPARPGEEQAGRPDLRRLRPGLARRPHPVGRPRRPCTG